MSVRLSEEERLERLREIREAYRTYPVIPYFKDEDELRWSLQHGNVDFIISSEDYTARTRGGIGFWRRTRPWGNASVGYIIRAPTIEHALGCVGRIVEMEKPRLIYFRVTTLDMPHPRVSYVDEAMRELDEIERELSLGNYIRRELHDC